MTDPHIKSNRPRDSLQDQRFRVSSRRLYGVGTKVALAGGAILAWQSTLGDFFQIALGLVVYALAIFPMLKWAENTRKWFPVFEIFMSTGVVFYAIPFLMADAALQQYGESTLMKAAIAVILFQAAAWFSFNRTRGVPARSRDWITALLKSGSLTWITSGIWLNSLYIYCSQFTDLIPNEIGSILRAIFFGIGTVSTFILARHWGTGAIRQSDKVTVVLNLCFQCVMMASQLYLINVLSIAGLALIGYVTSSRKIPIVTASLVFAVIAVLHSGKSQMRQIYWNEGQRHEIEFTALPDFFVEWFEYGLDFTGSNSENESVSLIERASLFQIIAVTVDTVPSKLPFLNGETYLDVPAGFVPRIFWANKPTALESNIRLSLYFGLVEEYSARSVSIAFGLIAEAFANFGFLGVSGLGILMGVLFKRVSVAAESADIISPLGILMIILTAWSLQVEMVAATWLSSLFQASVVTVIGPLYARRFLGL